MSIIGEFRVGQTIEVALDAISGDPGSVTGPTAWLASAEHRSGGLIIPETAERHALDVAPRAAAGDIPAGWTLTLAAAVSATLLPGLYGIDMKLPVAGGIGITDTTAFVRLTRSAAS